MEFTTKAIAMLSPDSAGRVFVREIQAAAEKITEPPSREFSIQRYASVMGDSIRTLEHEAVERSVRANQARRVCDLLGDFERKEKVSRNFLSPRAQHRSRRDCVKG